MSAEQNKRILKRIYDEAFPSGNPAVLDELVDRNVAEHEKFSLDQPPGLEGVKQTFEGIRKAFPDLKLEVHDIFAGEGDKVVGRATLTGTHKGELQGIAPTGKRITFEIIDIVRISSGKIVEHWGLTDALGLMQQLGVVPKT